MDKLIITVIGIALSAVAILWSANFMTSMYQNANSASLAQKWISDAGQVAMAARQAGSLSLSGDNWEQGSSTSATAAALIPNYLRDLPQHNGVYVFQPCKMASSSGTTTTFSCPVYVTDTTHATDATMIEATVENAAVCQQIQKLAYRGNTTLPTATTSGSTITYTFLSGSKQTLQVNGGPQFACMNASGTYYFLYRVFLDR